MESPSEAIMQSLSLMLRFRCRPRLWPDSPYRVVAKWGLDPEGVADLSPGSTPGDPGFAARPCPHPSGVPDALRPRRGRTNPLAVPGSSTTGLSSATALR